MLKQFQFWGINFQLGSLSAICQCIKARVLQSKQTFIATPNPEILLAAENQPELKKILNKTFNIPDGNGILWAKNLLEKHPHPSFWTTFTSLLKFTFTEKKVITGVDLTKEICLQSDFNQFSKFFLGAAPGVASAAQTNLQKLNPKVNIVGTSSINPDNPEVISVLKKLSPEILFVAYGAPKQELWIARHLPELPFVKVAIGIGGSFDFLSGKIPRAPSLLRKFGLEWLFRLIQEPRKRLPRIYNAVIRFPWKVIQKSRTDG